MNHPNPAKTLAYRASAILLCSALLPPAQAEAPAPGAASGAVAANAAPSAAWSTLHLQRHCEAMAPTHCRGFYGFTVDEHGHFRVGPNPVGQTIEGELTGDEWAGLKTAADQAAHYIAQNSLPECTPPARRLHGVGGSTDLTLRGTAYALENCRYNGDASATGQVTANMAQLLAKYYRVPF
jgi:hypothetical protein